MSLHRHAAKRDSSERAIVEALRRLGWSVEFLSIKNGPDLVIGRRGQTHLVEIKTGKRKLRPGQFDWHAAWRGSPVVVLRTVEDAIKLSPQTLGVHAKT